MSDIQPIRILLVDDHLLFRGGIASLLTAEKGFEVVGEAANGQEALEKARELMPDIILMDISMPGMGGLEATRRIKEEIPTVRIVVLTVSDEDQSLFDAIRSGAQGYLLKKMKPQALFSTLRGIMQGEAPLSRVMAAKLLEEFARLARREATPSLRPVNLSYREKEVLQLLSQGKTNKEIATVLTITENTTKSHLKNILEKLHLENRVQAVAHALRQGLIETSPEHSR
ncbi:MAG TPA: response regulator transcription factor [Candidatus Methylomirabilis sp.]|nr:response regulator transcription factor [Candidatus Methylomirabilis sp.]